MQASDDTIELITFFDAIAAADACCCLEDARIPFTIKDWGVPSQGIDRFSDLPPIQLQVFVSKRDVNRCQKLLRDQMHLFPEREVDNPMRSTSSKLDDEQRVQVAACEERSDAEEVCEALKESDISSSIEELSNDEDPASRSYSVEVRYEDTDRAFKVIERWSDNG